MLALTASARTRELGARPMTLSAMRIVWASMAPSLLDTPIFNTGLTEITEGTRLVARLGDRQARRTCHVSSVGLRDRFASTRRFMLRYPRYPC